MSVSYELLFLHSIPFLARVGDSDKAHTEGAVGRTEGAVGRKLYYYDTKRISDATEPIAIGSYENGAVKLDEGWQLRLQPSVDAWKGTLTASERGIVQPRAPKPSKPKRTSPKSTNTSGTTTTATTTTTTTATTTTATTATTSGTNTPPITGEEFYPSETANTNIVIIPETVSSPPNPKGRRGVVRTNAKAAL
jgi:hypothetical protein